MGRRTSMHYQAPQFNPQSRRAATQSDPGKRRPVSTHQVSTYFVSRGEERDFTTLLLSQHMGGDLHVFLKNYDDLDRRALES